MKKITLKEMAKAIQKAMEGARYIFEDDKDKVVVIEYLEIYFANWFIQKQMGGK